MLNPDTEKHIKNFRLWQEKTVRDNRFSCKPISFHESAEWYFNDGKLKHRTNGFFSLAGIAAEARHSELNGQEQLIILQHQIALNNYLYPESHLPILLFLDQDYYRHSILHYFFVRFSRVGKRDYGIEKLKGFAIRLVEVYAIFDLVLDTHRQGFGIIGLQFQHFAVPVKN